MYCQNCQMSGTYNRSFRVCSSKSLFHSPHCFTNSKFLNLHPWFWVVKRFFFAKQKHSSDQLKNVWIWILNFWICGGLTLSSEKRFTTLALGSSGYLGQTEGMAGNSKTIYEVCDSKSEKSAPLYRLFLLRSTHFFTS